MEKLLKIPELNLILKYAFRDLVRNYRKIFSIILTLFISLFILSAILTIEGSLKKELDDNAKSLLGGDVEIDYNRVQGNLELVDEVRKFATISAMVEFTTMVSSINDNNLSLFTRIKTVDKKYPLYGEVVHEPVGAMDRIHQEKNTIIVNENIFKTLDLKVNEKIKVQNQLFTVVGVIKSLPDVSGFVAFGDFAITSKETLELLKLNSLGSF
ncbi:ABC transporter permease, partial [bacterium]|nr:ABC transporter permease [bacterium]